MASMFTPKPIRIKNFEGIQNGVLELSDGGLVGTVYDFLRELGKKHPEYVNEHLETYVASSISILECDGKMMRYGSKLFPDGSEAGTGLIVSGVYGKPKK